MSIDVAPAAAASHTSTAETAVRGTSAGRRRDAALLAVSAAVAMQPILHPTGPANSSPVDLLVILAVGTTALWCATDRVPVRAPYAVAVGLMVVGGTLAGITGVLPGTALLAIVQDVVLLMWCAAVVAVAGAEGALARLVHVWAYSSVAWGCLVVLAWIGHVDAVLGLTEADGSRVLFTFGDPNYAATYWVTSFFVVLAGGRPVGRWWRRLACGVLLFNVGLTMSNGAVVELCAGLGLLALVRLRHGHGGVVAAVGAGAAAVVLLLAQQLLLPLSTVQTWAYDSGSSFLAGTLGRSDQSGAQRSTLIRESLALYTQDGVAGSGPGSTKELLHLRNYPYAKEAHDDYLAALFERGPIGFAGVLALVAGATSRALLVLRRREALAGVLPRPEALLAALASMGVAAFFYEVLHFRYCWLLLAFLAALAMHPGAAALQRRGASP
jgi:hypothetical protein